jgi:sn-glycerol 3-phosphate transport system substrate-binding protein
LFDCAGSVSAVYSLWSLLWVAKKEAEMKKILFVLLGIIVFMGPVFAAPITIEFWHAMTGKNGEITQAVCDKFNASQGDYKVVAVLKGSYPEALNAGIAAFRAGAAPAILQVQEVATATFMATKGAIRPVYQLMAENNEKFDPKAYMGAVRSYYSTADGKMLSMPFNSSTAVMYYNKEAFRKAGLDPENPPKTWPEVFSAARKIKTAGYEGGLTTNWISWIQLENFSAWHNVPFATRSNGMGGMDTELAINGPVELKHFTNLYNLSKEGVFIYGGRENKANPLFQTGRVGIHFESIGGYGTMKATCKFEFGVGKLPYYPDVPGAPQNSIIGGASLWVFNGRPAEEYKAVARFFSFLSLPETQAFWHQQTGYLPITNAAYELTKSQGYYKENPALQLAIDQLNNKTPTENSGGLRLGNFAQIREIEDQQWEDILAGKVTVKEGLDNMVKLGNAKLREFERANK